MKCSVMKARTVLGWALALLACATTPHPATTAEPPPPPRPSPQAAVRELVRFAYSTLEAGDASPLLEWLSPEVMGFGLSPSDTWARREPLLDAVRQQLLPVSFGAATLRVRSGRIDVGLSEDGTSAWFWDLPRVEWEVKGRTTTWLVRVTGHVVEVDGAWRLDAFHVSLSVPDEKLFAPGAAKKYLPPNDVAPERGPDADQLVGLARRVLDDVGVKFERVSERPEVVLLGTGPSEVFENGKRFKELLKPQLAALKKSVFSYRVEGPVRARLSRGGRTGWVAANVVLRQGSGKRAVTAPPFRVLWVFAEEGGLWNLVSEHQSLALKDDLREPASDEELKAFEALDGARRARVDPRPERSAARQAPEPPDAGAPARE